MSKKMLRDGLRILHLIAAIALASYLFTPLGDSGAVEGLARVSFGILVLTGGLMWKVAALRGLLRRRQGQGKVIAEPSTGT